MSALRQQVLAMVNVLPEHRLLSLLRQINAYNIEDSMTEEEKRIKSSEAYDNLIKIVDERKERQRRKAEEENSRHASPFTDEEWDAFVKKHEDPQKAIAFERLDALVQQNRHLYGKNIDYDKLRWEAINEKYGPFD